MIRILATIEDNLIYFSDEENRVWFHAAARIDSDGIGLSHGDVDWQNNTSLQIDGHGLNADTDRYIVVPPAIIFGVTNVILGCKAKVTNMLNNRSTDAVVGDIGPHRKLGEISIACAIELGINPSPVVGGEDRHVIYYELWPGQVAVVGTTRYALQPYRPAPIV